MENESISTLKKQLFLNRLYENSIINNNAEKAGVERRKVEQLCHETSPVYHKIRKPHVPGHLNCHSSSFQLIPYEPEHRRTELYSSSDDSTSNENSWIFRIKDGKFSRVPICRNTWRLWLTYLSGEEYRPQSVIGKSPTPVHPPSRLSDVTSCSMSTASTPLPVMGRRTPTKTFLFLRPTIIKPPPLPEQDDLFKVLTKVIDLKALPFRKIADSFRFYLDHFPLILTRNVPEGERSSTPSKRSRTPDSPMSFMINRQRTLNQRLVELDWMMQVIEQETEDIPFATELNGATFDPTKWPWNKVDAKVLKRRYTIDESFKDQDI